MRTRGRIVVGIAILLVALVIGLWPREKRQRATGDGRPATGDVGALDPEHRRSPVAGRPSPVAVSGALAGTVIDRATGKGVPGAQLAFSSGGVTTSVEADAAGRFEFASERLGKWRLFAATAKGYLPFAPEPDRTSIEVVLAAGTRVEGLVVELTPAVVYRAVVRDPEGKPIAGATVRLLGGAIGERAFQPLAERFLSDAQGVAQLSAPDWAIVEARKAGYAPAQAAIDVPAQVSHRVDLRMRPLAAGEVAQAPQPIAGKVVDAAGKPLAGARVRAFDDGPGGDEVAETESDDAGSFVLEGLPAGKYGLDARHEGYAPATRDGIAPGTGDVTLVLVAGGAIAGRVVDAATGKAVTAFALVVQRRVGPIRLEEVVTADLVDPEGRFALSDLPDDPLVVTAVARGYAPSPGVDARVGARDLELRVSRGGSVFGRVVDGPTKTPLAGARLTVEGVAGSGASVLPTAGTAVSDETGAFTLTGIGPGTRSITVMAADHHARAVSGLPILEGVAFGPIAVELSPVAPGETPSFEMTGVGAVLKVEGDALVVQATIPGGGAADAGIVPGDAIVAIDGAGVVPLGFQEALNRIRGPVGTQVVLRVRRGDAGTTVDLAVLRKLVRPG